MGDWHWLAVWLLAGVVFGVLVSAITGQWWWLAFGAGLGGVGSAVHRDRRNRRAGHRDTDS